MNYLNLMFGAFLLGATRGINRKTRIASFLLSAFLFGPSLQAQTGDWSLVQQIRPGTRIFVKARQRTTCVLVHVDDRTLICHIESPQYFRYSPEVYSDRRDVREVRLEHSDEFHTAVGMAVGFGVGTVVGLAKDDSDPRGSLIIGAVGGMMGSRIGPMTPLIHGRVVYRR